MGKGNGQLLTREAAAKRLCIGVADLPDLGKPWTGREVAEVQRSRPQWLQCARKALGAARAEQERQRKSRLDAVLARRTGCEYPPITAAATDFARDFAWANLLVLLPDALDAAAAETYVVDGGFDVSTHAATADETNRQRARRGDWLSGRDDASSRAHGRYRVAGTLGDLFDAPTGNRQATTISGAGFGAESWSDAWYDYWALENRAHAHVIADLVLRGDIWTLETIAGVALSDVAVEVARPLDGVAEEVLALAGKALHAWAEVDCPVLDPGEVVDMDAPVTALPPMLLVARRCWDQTELVAAAIAGLDVGDLADGSPRP